MELSLYIKDKLVSGKRVAIPIMTHPGIELLGKQVSDAVTNVCSLDMQMLRLCRFLRSNRDACLSICWPTAWQQKE